MNALLAVDVPADQPRHDLGQRPGSVSTRSASSTSSRRWRRCLLFFVGTRSKKQLVPAGIAEHRRVGRRLRPQPGHHADDGSRRARLPAVPHRRCSSSSSSATSPRSSRSSSSRRTRVRDADGARADGLGDLQRRRHQEAGPVHYLKNSLVPARACPKRDPAARRDPIEFISTFIVRPFSLMVRLFANMLAGHLMLVTFSVLTAALLGDEHHDRHRCRSRSRCSSP